jgi:chondroitin AC lyase
LDTDLALGTIYYYTLCSVDLSGNESAGTDQVAGTPAALVNLALGKPAVASSNEEHSQWYVGEPSHVCDGDLKTRWSSEYSDPQWIYVDLGAIHEIQQVVVFWEAAYAKAYEIQISSDAHAWITVFSTTDGDGGADVIEFDPVAARYVRVYGTRRGTGYGYSILELEVY